MNKFIFCKLSTNIAFYLLVFISLSQIMNPANANEEPSRKDAADFLNRFVDDECNFTSVLPNGKEFYASCTFMVAGDGSIHLENTLISASLSYNKKNFIWAGNISPDSINIELNSGINIIKFECVDMKQCITSNERAIGSSAEDWGTSKYLTSTYFLITSEIAAQRIVNALRVLSVGFGAKSSKF